MNLLARNNLIGELIDLLARADYDALLRKAPRSRITAQQIASAIQEYGRELIPLPPSGYGLVDSVAITGSRPPAWSVVVPLFTKEEGRSDLSLEITVVSDEDGNYAAEIDDIHVL